MNRREFLRIASNPRVLGARSYVAAHHRGEVPLLTDYELSIKFGIHIEKLFQWASTAWWQSVQRIR